MRQHCDLCILLFLLLGLSAAPSLQSPSSPSSSSSSPTAEEENGVGLGGGRRKESAQRRPLNEASEGRSSVAVDDDGIVAAEIGEYVHVHAEGKEKEGEGVKGPAQSVNQLERPLILGKAYFV